MEARGKSILLEKPAKRLLPYLAQVVFVVGMALAGIWLLWYGQLQRKVHHKTYAYTEDGAAGLQISATAQYDFGCRAFDYRNYAAAADYLRGAVHTDPLHIGAWLKLAEVERELDNPQVAIAIVAHSHRLTRRVLRWKWPETLLAFELKIENVFTENINFLIANERLRWDAARLLDIYFSRNVDTSLAALENENRLFYMQWLMRWERSDDVLSAWADLPEKLKNDPECRLSYVDFLISQNQIDEARRMWEKVTEASIENSGFDQPPLQKGFGWRFKDGPDHLWRVRRVKAPGAASNHVLEVRFSGRKNLGFHHLYQIVPVQQAQRYRLSYRWRAESVTTDQGPFVEVYGYDCAQVRKTGPMMLGSTPWQQAAFDFTPPADCHAVVVRLRRNISKRFDNKIEGTLWLDDFQLISIQNAASEAKGRAIRLSEG